MTENNDEIKREITSALKGLSSEAIELYLGRSVQVIYQVPNPLSFLRNFVAHNRPVLVKGGVSHWPALDKWSPEYLVQRLGDSEVTVTVTPDGLADSAVGEMFMMPEERGMKMADFIERLNVTKKNEVFYIQKQNSNLTDEFKEVFNDVDSEINWASEAFGKKPDAINFWMGDQRAITSMHKDPYENIYCVVRGHKDILLQPPSDVSWIPYRDLTPGVYRQEEDGSWAVDPVPGAEKIAWVDIDPKRPDIERFPEYKNSSVYRVRVEAGDCLYLPSFWFHHLTQSHGCVAVNYWYDMEFDVKYNYYNLLLNLKKIRQEF